MKAVAFVPVKLNNQRAPGKNTRRFSDGRALITVFLDTLVKVEGLDEIYVFCSNPLIQEYLVPGVSYLQRPGYLDAQEATPQDIIDEFMKLVDADIYAVCHCTSPFVTAAHIEECIEAVKSGRFDSSFTAERLQKLMWSGDNRPVNFDPECVPRTQDLEPFFCEVSAAYVFKREVFTTLRRRIGVNPHITEVAGTECIDIDYPEDFEMADAIYGFVRGGYSAKRKRIKSKVPTSFRNGCLCMGGAA